MITGMPAPNSAYHSRAPLASTNPLCAGSGRVGVAGRIIHGYSARAGDGAVRAARKLRRRNSRPIRPSIGSGRPDVGIAPRSIVEVGLRRIAVHERTKVEGMPHAADFVLDREKRRAIFLIDYLPEPVLMLIALLGDQGAFEQPAIGTGEIRDVDLDVMSVVVGERGGTLAKDELLSGADLDPRAGAARAVLHAGPGTHDFAVKSRDSAGGAGGYIELDVGDAEGYGAEARVGLMRADPIAPRAYGIDMPLCGAEGEFGAREPFAYSSKAC